MSPSRFDGWTLDEMREWATTGREPARRPRRRRTRGIRALVRVCRDEIRGAAEEGVLRPEQGAGDLGEGIRALGREARRLAEEVGTLKRGNRDLSRMLAAAEAAQKPEENRGTYRPH